jgi:hypothetical protein
MADADLTVKIRADIKDLQSKMSKVNKDLENTSKGANDAQKGFDGLSKTSKVLGKALIAIGIGAFAKNLLDTAIQAEGLAIGFERLGETAGISSTLLNELDDATMNTVSSIDLMKSANQALLLGIDPDALPAMFEGAAKVAVATGQTTTQAINDITTGIGRQSRMILDNLGIIVKTEEANRAYAESIGKVVSELTEEEKKLAFTKSAIDALALSSESIGEIEDTLAIQTGQLKKEYDELVISLAKSLVPALKKVVSSFNETIELSKQIRTEEQLAKISKMSAIEIQEMFNEQTEEGTTILDAYKNALQEYGNQQLINAGFSRQQAELMELTSEEVVALVAANIVLADSQSVSNETVATANEVIAAMNQKLMEGNEARALEGELIDENTSKRQLETEQLNENRNAYHDNIDSLKKMLTHYSEGTEQYDKIKGRLDAEKEALRENVNQRKGVSTELDKTIKLKDKEVSQINANESTMAKDTDERTKNAGAITEQAGALNASAGAMSNVNTEGINLNGKTFSFTVLQHVRKIYSSGKQSGGVIHAQGGISVPGQGTGDKVPAMLEPGEFVLNRNAVKSVGLRNLNNLNFNTSPRFAGGGSVGGSGGGNTIIVNIDQLNGGDATSIAEALQEQLQDLISS